MRKERNSFSITTYIYMPSAGLHGPLYMVCALSPVPAPTLALDLHAHTVVLPAAAWAEGWRGACTQMYSSYSL